jgi:hypothetical protein
LVVLQPHYPPGLLNFRITRICYCQGGCSVVFGISLTRNGERGWDKGREVLWEGGRESEGSYGWGEGGVMRGEGENGEGGCEGEGEWWELWGVTIT